MPGIVKARKITKEKEGEVKMCLLDVLMRSDEALNTDEIKLQEPFVLGGYTTQKLSRLLNSLIEMGLVVKSKSKSTNRLKYKAVAKMREQGYEVEDTDSCDRAWNGVEWDIEDEREEEMLRNGLLCVSNNIE